MSALRRRLRLFALLIAALPSLWSHAARACEHPLRVVFGTMPPFMQPDGRGDYSGLEVELVRAIVRQAGCTLQVLPELPRKRRYSMFLSGEIDMLLAATETPERREIAWFTAPYRQETTSLFVLSRNAERLRVVDSFDSMLARRVSLLSLSIGWFGPEYAQALPRLGAANLVSHFDNLRQGLSMLAAGRGDVLMGDRVAILHAARERGIALTELSYTPARESVHLMLSRKSVSEADWRALNQAVQTLEERGVLREIRARYGLR